MQTAYNKNNTNNTISGSVQLFLMIIDNMLKDEPASAEFEYRGHTYVYFLNPHLYIKKPALYLEDNEDYDMQNQINIMSNLSINGYDSLYDFVCDYKNNHAITDGDFLKLFTFDFGIDGFDFVQMLKDDSNFNINDIKFREGYVNNNFLVGSFELWRQNCKDMKFIERVFDKAAHILSII